MNKLIKHITIDVDGDYINVVIFYKDMSPVSFRIDTDNFRDVMYQLSTNKNYILNEDFTFTFEGNSTTDDTLIVYLDNERFTRDGLWNYVTEYGIVYVTAFNNDYNEFSGNVIANNYEDARSAVAKVISWRSNPNHG